jgi:hypothetical protein
MTTAEIIKDPEIPMADFAKGILKANHNLYRLYILRSSSVYSPILVQYHFFWIETPRVGEPSPKVALWTGIVKHAESVGSGGSTLDIEDARKRWRELMEMKDYETVRVELPD